MIDKNFIEKSLALCWKEYSDMWIESYCYFLLSPEFIEKYRDVIADFYDFDKTHLSIELFAKAVWYYQKWNEKPLIELLSKIWN